MRTIATSRYFRTARKLLVVGVVIVLLVASYFLLAAFTVVGRTIYIAPEEPVILQEPRENLIMPLNITYGTCSLTNCSSRFPALVVLPKPSSTLASWDALTLWIGFKLNYTLNLILGVTGPSLNVSSYFPPSTYSEPFPPFLPWQYTSGGMTTVELDLKGPGIYAIRLHFEQFPGIIVGGTFEWGVHQNLIQRPFFNYGLATLISAALLAVSVPTSSYYLHRKSAAAI